MKHALALAAALLCAPAALLHAQAPTQPDISVPDATVPGSVSNTGNTGVGQPGTPAPGASTNPVTGQGKPAQPAFDITRGEGDQNGDALQSAYTDFQAGKLEAAAAKLRVLVKNQPDNVSAHSLLGYVYLKQNQNHFAVLELETVTKLAPKDAAAHKNLGRAYLQTGQFDGAAEQFRTVLAKTPKDPDALSGVAFALGQAGRADEAAAAFQNLVAVQPTAQNYQNLGITLNKAGKTALAAAAFRKAADLNPKDGVSWLNAGLLYAQAGQNSAAADSLTHAIGVGGPDKYAALLTRGQVYGALKQDDKAMADFSAASVLRPTEAVPLYNLAVLQQNAGQKADAEANYRKVLDLKPMDAQILGGTQVNLGLLLAADSNAAEAVPLLEQVVQSDSKNPGPHAALASLYAKQGDPDKAVAERRTVLALSPDDNENRVALADLLSAQKDTAGAIALYKDAAVREPKNASLRNALGAAYVQAGNLDGALGAFQAALTVDPQNAQAANNMGVIYDRQGKKAQAIAAYKKAVALDPTLADAKRNLARYSLKPAVPKK